MEAVSVSQLADDRLDRLNDDMSKSFGADVVLMKSAMESPLDHQFRIELETIKREQSEDCRRLCIVLETQGGYIETVKRLVDVMRRHYDHVTFVIPSYAYSAGTVLVLSGDEIYMDYYSVLGPIDPQVSSEDGGALLPGAGYLAKFEELLQDINKAQKKDPRAKQAELAYLIRRFEPAKLFDIEQAIEHGIALIATWLPQYKFKSWTRTDSEGKTVTEDMRKERAEKIAKVLGDTSKWHSHGRGISMVELEEIGLKIDDFGKDEERSRLIRNYHGLAVDYAGRKGYGNFIHSRYRGMRRIL